MSKHTLGPWVYYRNWGIVHSEQLDTASTKNGGDFEGCSENQLNEVCKINRLHVYERWTKDGYRPAREDVRQRVNEMADANARLITAAPLLLDALQMAKHIVANEGNDEQMAQVFAAIEAATGEEP